MMKKMSILLAGALLVTSLNTSPVLAAKKTKTQYGYAFKGGKLVSIEIKGDKYKEKLHDAKHPLVSDKIKGDRFIYCEKYGEDKDGRYFLTDNTGKKVSGAYEGLYQLEEGVFAATKNGKRGVIDGNETVLVPFEYGYIEGFSEGIYRIAIKDGKEEWKYGLVNKAGVVILPVQYSHITGVGGEVWSRRNFEDWKHYSLGKNLAEISLDKGGERKVGLINNKGEIVLPAEYDYFFSDDTSGKSTIKMQKVIREKTEDGEKEYRLQGVLNKTGKVIFPAEYEIMNYSDVDIVEVIKKGKKIYSKESGFFQLEGKSGLINKKGKVILPIQYNLVRLEKLGKNLASVKADGKAGFVKKGQEKQVVLEYDDIGKSKESLILVKKGDKYGYVNKTGKLVLPMIYDQAKDFSDGLAYVKEGNKEGFINKKGKMVLEEKQSEGFYSSRTFEKFEEGLTIKEEKDKTSFINKKGEVVLSFSKQEYDSIDYFQKGLARVGKKVGEEKLESGGARLIFKYGAINKQGKLVIPLEYDAVDIMNNGLIKVRVGDWETGKSGLMDKSGRLVTPIEYNYVGNLDSFKSGLIVVTKDKNNTNSGKKGLIDKKGKLILPVEYDVINEIKRDLVWIGKGEGVNRREGLINSKGKWIIPLEYENLRYFRSKGILYASKGVWDGTGKVGLFTEKGKQILAPIYRYIEDFTENNIYRVIKGTWEKGKQGYINQKGKFVIPLKYDYAYGFKNGSPYAKVRRKGKWGLVNKRGKVIMPLKYNNIELIQE